MQYDKNLIKEMEKIAKTSNMVNDEEAAWILGITKKTLFNRVSGGHHADLYTISPITGKRFWFKDKIMGL